MQNILKVGKDSGNRILKEMYLKLLPQQMIAGLIFTVNTIVDSLVTSRFLGTDAMAALGFYSPVSNILYLCYILITGTQVLCGKSIGRGQKKETVSVFSTCVFTMSVFAIICGVVMFLFPDQIASLLGARGASRQMLSDYMRNVAYGVPGMMLYALFINFLQLNNRTDLSKISLAVMLITNAGLDLLFTTVFNMGMGGMGLSTSISNIVTMAVAIIGFFPSAKKPVVYLQAGSYSFSKLPEMTRIGSTQAVFNLVIAFRSFLLNIILVKLGGTDAVAVMTVLNMFCSFFGMIPTGNANSSLTLGSIFTGEKNRGAMGRLLIYSLRTASIMSLVTIAVVMIFAPQLASVFYQSGSTVWLMTVPMLRIFVWFLLFASMVSIVTRIWQSQGQVMGSNILSVTETLLMTFLAFILSQPFGLAGVWLAYPLSELISFVVIYFYIQISIKRPPKTREDWAGLGSEFDVLPENESTIEVTSMEEVLKVSADIMNFLKERQVDVRTCSIAGLAVEEMAGNIVEHGFTDRKKHAISIFLVKDEKEITIRIRDDCRMFDPVLYLEQFTQEDPVKNVGIKMIAKIAREMKYEQLLGLNYLMITL